MTERNGQYHKKIVGLSRLSRVFLENNLFLKKYLRRFFYREQDIEDVVQETYIKACNADKASNIDHPKAYLFRIAKNLALNELDKRSRRMTDFIEECEAANIAELSESLEEQMQAEQSVDLYCRAAAMLPERCRGVYLLRKVHGLSHNEIATRLGITPSAVAKHLTKGMLKCQKYIEMGGDQSDRSPVELELGLQLGGNEGQGKEESNDG